MTIAIIAAAASILVATISAIAAYLLHTRLERHRNQLARVNLQPSKLYGPLHSITQANGIAYKAMRDRNDPEWLFDQRTAQSTSRLTESQRETYKLWMTTVFQPTNRAARDVPLTNTDLLIGGIMPLCALQWFTHVLGYDAAIRTWDVDGGDTDDLFSHGPVSTSPAALTGRDGYQR